MGMFTAWMNSAAEDTLKESIKSSMDVCSQIRRDGEADHEKLESLHWCWKTISEMQEEKTETPVKKEEPIVQQPTKTAAAYSYSTIGPDKFKIPKPAVDPDNYVTARISK